MRHLFILLAFSATNLSGPALAAPPEGCTNLRDAVKIWNAANAIYDVLEELQDGTNGPDQDRLEMLQWAAWATTEARNNAEQAAAAIFWKADPNDQKQAPQTIILSHALSARTAYQTVVDNAVRNGGPLLVKTLKADRPPRPFFVLTELAAWAG